MTYNIVISHIFSENFIDIPQIVQKIWRFFSFNINYFRQLFGIFDISLLQINLWRQQITGDVRFFYFQPTLNRLFNSCIKLYWHKISFSWNMKGMGQTDHPHLLHQKKLLSKSPALLGLKWKLAPGSFCCRSRKIRLCLLLF